MIKRSQENRLPFLAVGLLGSILYAAQGSQSAAGKIQKPSFAGSGGPHPTSIESGDTATIKLPGTHLSGATLTVSGGCKLVSYKVISDNEIQAAVQGARNADDKNDYCTFSVKNNAGSASTWIVVALTNAQEQEKKQHDRAAGEKKIKELAASAGTAWQIHFADGTEITYQSKGSNADGMPTFLGSDGQTIGILVRPDHSVFIIEEGCVLTGSLHDGQVKDGKGVAGCPHGGTWTATMQ